MLGAPICHDRSTEPGNAHWVALIIKIRLSSHILLTWCSSCGHEHRFLVRLEFSSEEEMEQSIRHIPLFILAKFVMHTALFSSLGAQLWSSRVGWIGRVHNDA